MAFAVHMALKAPPPAAIAAGLAWGVGIMSLDRWLVSSMTRKQGMLLVIPRVLLAILFSVVISTPLTLQIFNSEIAQQMSLDHASAAAAFATSPAVAKLQAKVNADEATVTGYQEVISSGGAKAATSPANDPTLTQLEAQLTSDENQVTYYRNAAHCEEYGGSGCSTTVGGNVVVGTGSAYNFDEQQLTSYTQQVATDNQNIAAERTTLAAENKTDESSAVSNARANLSYAQAQLTADTNALNQLKSNFDVTNTNNTGILARLKALDELRMSDLNMLVAEIVLFLFFAAIELLPVIVKLLLNRGEETPYEQAVAAADVINVMREEYAQRSRYMETVRQHNQDAAQARAIQTAWEEVMPQVTERTVEARRRVELDRIARWQHQALIENSSVRGGLAPAGLPRLKRGGPGDLPGVRIEYWPWVRWLPWIDAKRPPARQPSATLPATKPMSVLDSGPQPKARDPYGL